MDEKYIPYVFGSVSAVFIAMCCTLYITGFMGKSVFMMLMVVASFVFISSAHFVIAHACIHVLNTRSSGVEIEQITSKDNKEVKTSQVDIGLHEVHGGICVGKNSSDDKIVIVIQP